MTASRVEDTAWYSYTSSTQTMKTWARVLKTPEEIPKNFQTVFPAYDGPFPHTVLLPEDRYSLFSVRHEKMLCMLADQVLLFEDSKKGVHTRSIPFCDVLYVEQGRVLLNSWLKIRSASETLAMRFNTTNIRCFMPVIDTLRREAVCATPQNDEEEHDEQERKKLNYLDRLNYKYMSYGRGSIRSGDRVKTSLYQAPRCLRTITFLGRVLLQQHATSHLSILTDKELIFIKEQDRIKTRKKGSYGGVFTYIPLRQIEEMTLTHHGQDTGRHQRLKIHFPGRVSRFSDYAEDNTTVAEFHQTCRAALQEESFNRLGVRCPA